MRLIQSIFYAFLMTCFGMSFVLLGGIIQTSLAHQDVNKFIGQAFVGGLLAMIVLTDVFYRLNTWIEERNREGQERLKKLERDGYPAGNPASTTGTTQNKTPG